MTVAIRLGLARGGGRAPARSRRCCRRSRSRSPRRSCATTYTHAWAFFLAGLLAPGLLADPLHPLDPRGRRLADVGRGRRRRRSSPLAIAFAFLDEPRRAAARRSARSRSSPAGSLLAGERDRPDHLRGARARSSRSARRCSSPCATTSSARCTPHGEPGDGRGRDAARRDVVALAWARRLPSRRELRRARAGRGSCSGSPTSASSRRTSAGRSRSSRRSSRPSRSGASGSRRSSSGAQRGRRAAARRSARCSSSPEAC